MTPEALAELRRDAEAPETALTSEIDAVAEDLAAAFEDDPMFEWFMKTGRGRDRARFDLFRFLLRETAIPVGWALRPAVGGGASVWIPSMRMGPSRWWEELRSLPVILAATGFSRLDRMAAMRAAMEKHHPGERPHIYLWLLGVRPEAQGAGVGSRLLRAGLDRADAQDLPVFLETATTRNVALYRRHGFEVLAEYRAREDAPLSWAMWREPRAG